MLTRKLAAAALLLGSVFAGPAFATTLFSQPTDSNGAFASQNDTNGGGFGNFATVYDDFTLGSSATVATVLFTGSYFNPPSAGVIAGFTLKFWSDLLGPNTVLFTEAVAGNANETSLGPDSFGDPMYSYSVNLSGGGFAASGGTTYWLSIVPDLGVPPQWGWETAGPGSAYQDFFGPRVPIFVNLAFELDGRAGVAAVPEPATLALFGAGLAGLGAIRRRRKGKA